MRINAGRGGIGPEPRARAINGQAGKRAGIGPTIQDARGSRQGKRWFFGTRPAAAPARSIKPHARAMRAGLPAAMAVLLSGPAFTQTRIDSINTNFRWLGPDDKIIVERYDDPRVQNVSCYLSRAETGGIKGGLGFAEDPSRFSIACRAVGPVTMPPSMPRSEVIAFSKASLFFKSFQIHRALDPEKHVLVYTVVSTKLINGSPFNSISVVPTDVR